MVDKFSTTVLDTPPSSVDGPYDSIFLGLAQQHENIAAFVDTFFSFLSRRTDFFCVNQTGRDTKGFPPGFCDQLIKKAVFKYQRHAGIMRSVSAEDTKKGNSKKSYLPGKNFDEEEEKSKKSIKDINQSTKKIESTNSTLVSMEKQKKTATVEKIDNKTVAENQSSEIARSHVPKPCSKGNSGKGHISTWNGGRTEKYLWSQSIEELSVEIELPEGTVSKHVNVDIKATSLKVTVGNKVYLEGELKHKVNAKECFWNVEDGKQILISLEKGEETWWSGLLEGDEEIDTKTIESTKNLTDYDEETQAQVRNMMEKQRLKQMGMLSHTGNDQNEGNGDYLSLEKAMLQAEGSPFQKQGFDPS